MGHLLENNSLMSLSFSICDTAWGWLQVVYPVQDGGRDLAVVWWLLSPTPSFPPQWGVGWVNRELQAWPMLPTYKKSCPGLDVAVTAVQVVDGL